MHIIEPSRYQQPQPRKKRRGWLIALPVALLVVAVGNYARPVPAPIATVHVSLPAAAPQDPTIAWPGQGQAAVAAENYGLIGTHGDMTPIATASIAKLILALCVLDKQPLTPSAAGQTYTVDAQDVASYEHYAQIDGSLIPVTEGEKLTEYQALQALMLPSANNIADSLANWVFGSQAEYKSYATDYLRRHDLNQTHIGSDASGFAPDTVSTSSDITNLGLLALKNPVLMDIVGQKSATLPVTGTVRNYNTVLGTNGITGLKTGNNDADPGAFAFSATTNIGGTDVFMTGAVMGAPSLESALQSSAALAASLTQGFEKINAINAGQSVGGVHTAWGATATLVPDKSISLVRWKSTPLTQTSSVDVNKRSGTVGTLKVSAGKVQSQSALKLQKPLSGPSFWWRLTRH